MTLYPGRGKRLFDSAMSVILLIGAAPVLLCAALAIWWRLGSPVFWLQQRPGRGGRPFTLIKFRTMTDATDASGELLPDADRMTRLGALLRSTSIDELPELLNVLRGDMSLVGPRPLLLQYVPRYTPQQARRHEVLPGITGLAQISGRNALTWEEKFKLDVQYVDSCSFALDLKILATTVGRVLARRDITQPGHATAREFMGSVPR
jgi:lipopolysaccharide/colanic/teichoic acid biosynthesis glycosyltransferase